MDEFIDQLTGLTPYCIIYAVHYNIGCLDNAGKWKVDTYSTFKDDMFVISVFKETAHEVNGIAITAKLCYETFVDYDTVDKIINREIDCLSVFKKTKNTILFSLISYFLDKVFWCYEFEDQAFSSFSDMPDTKVIVGSDQFFKFSECDIKPRSSN